YQRHVPRRRGVRAAHHLHDHGADHAGRGGRPPAARRSAPARAQVGTGGDPGPRRAHLYGPGGALVRRLPRHLPRVRANQTAHWGVPSGRRSGPLRRRGAGAGGDPGVGGERRGAGSGAGDGATVKRRARSPSNVGIGLAGTVLVHVLGALFLVGAANARKPAPPTYRVHLVAAPAPTEDARKAPEAVERPAEEKPAPAPKAKSPKSTVAPPPPPPVADNTKPEAAPRTTPTTPPPPGEQPSTGSDPLTVSTEGIE